MDRITRFALLIAMVTFTVSQSYAQSLRLARVNVFSDAKAILEFEGKLPVNQLKAEVPLPDSVIYGSVKAEAIAGNALISYTVVQNVKVVEKPVGNLKELFNSNIGKQVEIEALEGNESVTYEGTILNMRADGELLLLKNGNKVEAIPLVYIAHASFLGGSKALLDQLATTLTLQIALAQPTDSVAVRIAYAVTGVGYKNTYTLTQLNGSNNLSLETFLSNNAITAKKADVWIYPNEYQPTAAGKSNFGTPINLGSVDLFESVSNNFNTLDFKTETTVNYKINGSTLAHFNKSPKCTCEVAASLAVLNPSNQYLPNGELIVVDSTGIILRTIFPATVPLQRASIPLTAQHFDVNCTTTVSDIPGKGYKIDGKRYALTMVDIRLQGTQYTPKQALIEASFILPPDEKGFILMQQDPAKKNKIALIPQPNNWILEQTMAPYSTVAIPYKYYLLKAIE